MTALVGDLLAVFTTPTPSRLPVRYGCAPWRPIKEVKSLLFSAPTGPLWKGYPVLTTATKGWRFWLLGELIGSRANDAESLRKWWESGGDPTQLNGHFLLLGWEGEEQRWHLWTDRFGTVHCYYGYDGRSAALGTYFAAVAAAASRRKLDWVGLNGFFSFGFFPGDRTYFCDVQILRPATYYVFNNAGLLVKRWRYWSWYCSPDHRRSFATTVGDFAAIFDEVMSDALRRNRVAVPISGGLDSRCTVAVFGSDSEKDGNSGRVWSYSYGYGEDSIEIRLAQQVAAARNLPFTAVVVPPYLFQRLEQILEYTEGFQDITQCRQMCVRDELADRADVIVSALWGDVWCNDAGLPRSDPPLDREGVFQQALRKFEKPGRQWLVDFLCRPHLGAHPEHQLLELMRQEMRPLETIEDADFRVKAFKTEQWSFRWSLPPVRVFQSAAQPKLIFYDGRLTDFFATVPARYVVGRRLQVEYLKRFAPDLARIAWQPYNTDLFHYHLFNTWLIPKRVVNKLWRLVGQRRLWQRNWEVQFLSPGGRAGLQQWLLEPGLRLFDLVEREEVQRLVDRFYAQPIPKHAYSVAMLLTFSVWLERYG